MSLVGARTLDRPNSHRYLSVEPEASGRVLVDLANLRWVDPHGLVLIATQADAAHRQGLHLEVVPPESVNVANYLSRMGLRGILDARTEDVPLARVSARPLENELVELQECSNLAGFERLANFVFDRLSERRYHADTINIPFAGLAELGANVVEHAGVGGFVAAQLYKLGQPDEHMVFAVGDAGVGIRESLSRSHEPRSDRHALELARTEGVSGTGDPGKGIGLATLFDDATGVGGSVSLWSDTASRVESGRGNAPVREASIVRIPGAILSVRVPLQPGRRRRVAASGS